MSYNKLSILLLLSLLSIHSMALGDNTRRATATEVQPANLLEAERRAFEGVLDKCKKTSPNAIGDCIDKSLPNKRIPIQKGSKNFPTVHIENLYQNTPLVNDACTNGNFNQGLAAWKGFRMRHSMSSLPLETGLTAESPFFSNNCESQSIGGKTCLNITDSSQNDPALLPIGISIKQAFAGKGLQLGGNLNPSNKKMAEGISRKFIVTANNTIYDFKYAITMDHSHPGGAAAFFQAIAVDAKGNIVDRYEELADSSNPFINITPTVPNGYGSPQYYRDWNCASLDLRSHVGKEVMIYFLNSDCAAGGHRGHTYVDDICLDCKNPQQGKVEITALSEECLREDETINVTGSYIKPANFPNVKPTFELHIVKNNNPTPIKIITNYALNGNSYTFDLNYSDLPQKECYDIVVVMRYTLKGKSVEVRSSKKDGIKTGVNNDICLNCKPKIPDPIVFDPCCPPWNVEQLKRLFKPVFPGNSAQPYNYIFDPSLDPGFFTRMQSYIDLVNIMDSSVTQITISLRVFDKGTGNLPTPHWPNTEALGQQPVWLTWTSNSSNSPAPQPNPIPLFFKSISYGGDIGIGNQPQFEANRWYAVSTGIYLEGGKRLFPKKCDENAIYYRWSTMGFRTDGTAAVGTIEISDGKKIIQRIPVK